MSLHSINHPLAAHFINQLRDKNTTSEEFRRICKQVTKIIALEASRDLPLEFNKIDTPLVTMDAGFIERSVVVVSILRAGIGMVDPIAELFPKVEVGYVGMERDEATAEASTYYVKLPPLEKKTVFVVDPMLATGGSSAAVLEKVYDAGADDVSFLCIVAAPEGIAKLENQFRGLRIYAGAVDEKLNEQKYIVPGLGDFGDRLFGT